MPFLALLPRSSWGVISPVIRWSKVGPARGWRPQVAMSATRTDSRETGMCETAHLIGVNKGFLNLWGVSGGYLGGCTSWVEARVLGMPNLHKEFQVLVGHDLMRREEFNLSSSYI